MHLKKFEQPKEKNIIHLDKEGVCAHCEKMTHRYDQANEEYICQKCSDNKQIIKKQ